MKKGALSAVVLFVLVVGVLGAVLLYSGTSGSSGASPVETSDNAIQPPPHTAEECVRDFICKGLPGMKGDGGLEGTMGTPRECEGANSKGQCKCINEDKPHDCTPKKTCTAKCEVKKRETLKRDCNYYGVGLGGQDSGCWCVITKKINNKDVDEYRPCSGRSDPIPPPSPAPGSTP